MRLADTEQICARCANDILAQDRNAREKPVLISVVLATSLAGAALGAALWAALLIFLNVEVGWIAVAVGALAGVGARIGARGARRVSVQLAATGAALVGLLAGKYFAYLWAVREHAAAESLEVPEWFDPRLFEAFTSDIAMLLSPYDFIWAVVAIGAAWSAAVPRKVDLSA